MKPEIKKQWCDALRSGEYEQTAGALHNQNGFCCLGVLCDLHRKACGGPEWVRVVETFQYFKHGGTIPSQVEEWASLRAANPLVKGVHLSSINDQGKTFPEIADLIERYL